MDRKALAIGLALAILAPSARSAEPKPAKAEEAKVYTGKVLTVGAILDKQGIKVDADAAAAVSLVAEDGTTYSLVKDDISRRLFLDSRLHDRSVKLTGKKVAGSQMLQLTNVQTVKDGKVFDVFYWCENCQLAWKEPGACKCCGGETVLTEMPVKVK